jgi:ATP-binding cassette subfamily F protein uup
MGDWKQVFGDVVIGANTKIAYFDQARAGLDDAASIYDNVSEGRGRIEMGDQILEVRAYLERFLFDPQKQKQPVGSLSGGERARVALAKLLRHGANLIMLDEPTNDLDVATLSALEEMLIAFDGTALVVTHDRWFLNRIATSILAFEGDGKAIVYAGNYETYRRLKAEAKERESLIPPPSVPSAKAAEQANRKPKNPRSITYAEQIELDGIMEKIEQAEAAVQKIEAQLADPQLYSTRGDEVPALRKQLLAAQEAAGRLLARWEELEAKKSKG